MRSALAAIAAPLLFVAPDAGAFELKAGSGAPDVRAELLGGGSFELAQLRGKVVVINYWATWCAPCREEMPALDALYRKYRNRGLAMLAVALESPADTARIEAFMARYTFPAALAAKTQAENYGRPRRLPLTFVVDRRGVLRFDGRASAGALDFAALERIVLPLLRQDPAL